MGWVPSILTLGVPHNEESKITHAINLASEEIFNCRLTILQQSIEGHLYVSKQPYIKFMKTNKNKCSTSHQS